MYGETPPVIATLSLLAQITLVPVSVALVGACKKVITTSSEEGPQPGLDRDHLKVYEFPDTPLNEVEAELEVLVFPVPKLPPVPDTIDHEPEEPTGRFPCIGIDVSPQVAVPTRSTPAFAIAKLTSIGNSK